MAWPFWKDRPPEKKTVFRTEIPRDADRRGPPPPPPRTAHAPGVRVYAFAELPPQNLLHLDKGYGGFFLERGERRGEAVAMLVLTGGGNLSPSPGEVLVWSPSFSLAEISRTSPDPHRCIRRDGLTGTPVPGITGLRVLARAPEAGLAVLRLGPPPGARWVFKGVTAVAVFSGRLAAFDGEDVKVIRAGSLARVADPSATLYLEAGNDAALAVALAAEDFVAALG